LHVPLYGDQLADVLACAGTLTLAATTGVLRIVGDRHYATDVLVGAMIGFTVGYGMPTLLHYGNGRSDAPAPNVAQPLGTTVPIVPTISGVF
jgi:membrane-associated phospholipid phosphatase